MAHNYLTIVSETIILDGCPKTITAAIFEENSQIFVFRVLLVFSKF